MDHATLPATPLPTIDPTDQQRHCLLGFRHGPTGLGLFQVVDVASFRGWLSSARFTDASEGADEASPGAAAQRSIAFSSAGLKRLGWSFAAGGDVDLGGEYGKVDGQAFAQGAGLRAGVLDADEKGRSLPMADDEHPATWQWGFATRPHFALVVAAGDIDAVKRELDAPPGTTRITLHLGKAGAHVLGFADGLSQPVPKARVGSRDLSEGAPSADQREVGDFLLGDDLPRDVPLALAAPTWARGSSFLAARVFALDVAAFNASMREAAAESGTSVERVRAQVMGRWDNGTPYALSPEASLPPPHTNAFTLPAGHGPASPSSTPLTAHMRRSNPRDGRPLRESPRILRRGFVNASEFVFLCYQASLETQFEHIWNAWIRRAMPHEPPGQRDALLGRGVTTGAREVELGSAAPGVPPRVRAERRRFAKSVAGEYFLLPTLSLLRAMAAGPEPRRA